MTPISVVRRAVARIDVCTLPKPDARSLLIGSFVLFFLAGAAHATPPILDPIGNQSVREGAALNIPLSGSDPDPGEQVTFSSLDLPGFCGITNGPGANQGDIDCNPGAGTANTYTVTVTATDDSLLLETTSETFDIVVTANTPPTVDPINNESVAEGGSINIAFTSQDGDGDGMTFAPTTLPGFCSLNDGDGAGSIDCNPQAGDANTYNITITVEDDAPIPAQGSASFQLTVTANMPPTVDPINDATVAEGGSINIAFTSQDADGDDMTFAPTTLPGFCSLNDGNGAGSIDCNPQAGDANVYNITITVEDDAPVPAQGSTSFQLTVGANTPPEIDPIPNQTVSEGEILNIPVNSTDADGDAIVLSTANLPAFCALTDNTDGTGSVDCSPLAGDAGTYTDVRVIATDDAPIPGETFERFRITVGANAPPDLTDIPDQNVVEEGTLNIPISATDPEDHNMTISATDLPAFCSLTDNGDGTGSIDCSPAVGDAGDYPITVTVTDDGPVPAESSDPFTLTVGANEPPTANNVVISGVPSIGEELTGSYEYDDTEGDLEGITTFQWLRDGAPIAGATATTYTIVIDDVETDLSFEVTPVALTGALQGTPVASATLRVSNSAPSITGQPAPIEIDEDTSREIVLADVTVVDADTDPENLTLNVADGVGYTRSGPNGNTITPDPDLNGDLSVVVTVNDGFVDSDPPFNLIVTVLPVNDPPVFNDVVSLDRTCGEVPLQLRPPCVSEDATFTVTFADLDITDVDNAVPEDLTLTLDPNVVPADNYTVVGPAQVQPAENFNGQILVRALVSDLEEDSAPFEIPVDVESVNDLPAVETPIGSQTFIEDAVVPLNIAANFSDADGDSLTYEVSYVPDLPPERNISFDETTGQFSGPPRFEPDDPDDPVYMVTVTARDGNGGEIDDTFDLTISQLGRANLGGLTIDVSSSSAMPNDRLVWTFTSDNGPGPADGEGVVLSGSFIGDDLTVGVEGGAACTVNTANTPITFSCPIGALPVGAQNVIELSTTVGVATEVVTFATTQGPGVPKDPNPANNTAVKAAGVSTAFSLGAVQSLGGASVLSIAAGDVNGDGVEDIVLGTISTEPVRVFLADVPRETCDCQRDFLETSIVIPDSGANEGVALADLDDDGDLDLVVANSGNQPDTVWLNDGAGNFTQSLDRCPAAVERPTMSTIGDFNNDGNLDFAVAANSPNFGLFRQR